jgi:hypothetical protein
MKEYFYKIPVQAIQFNGEYTEEVKVWIEAAGCFGRLLDDSYGAPFIIYSDIFEQDSESIVVGVGEWIVFDEFYDFPFICYSEGVFKDSFQTQEELESKAVSKFLDSAQKSFNLKTTKIPLFPIQKMESGALLIYDKDPDFPDDIHIIINGTKHNLGQIQRQVYFEDIIDLDKTNKGFTYPNNLEQVRMSYKNSIDDEVENVLRPGDCITLVSGMVFWASATTPVPITKEDFPNIELGED